MTRRGKIARLPRDVRDELNQRMENGEPGKDLVAWLNGLSEVKGMLEKHFGGREITEQNLSEWKTGGGYEEWLAREEETAEAQDCMAAAEKMAKSARSTLLADHLARVLLVRYTEALANWKGPVTPEFQRKLEVLRGLRKDVVAMRRSEHEDIRVEMAHERFGWDQERFEWEAEKADEDSLDREFERKEKHRQKLSHLKWLNEMAEKYSKPPPKEDREAEKPKVEIKKRKTKVEESK